MKSADVLKVTGLQILRKMRGLKKVTFHGDCDIVRADLVPEMMKPKEATKGARKRKAMTKHQLKMATEGEVDWYGCGSDYYDDDMDKIFASVMNGDMLDFGAYSIV